MKIKVNDNVLVTVGKDRGKVAVVEKVFPKLNKVVVKGVNIIKKHQKKSKRHPKGGILEKFSPISINKVQVICPSCNRLTRIGFMIKNNDKIRICRKCQSSLEVKENKS